MMAETASIVTDSDRPRVFLAAGGDRRLGRGHLWAFSNEIRMDADAKAIPPGSVVALHRVDGKPVGVGTFNPHTLIAFRLLASDRNTAIDQAFLERRLTRALRLREALFDEPFFRLVHAEADGLPGLVVDRFGETVVLQANTAGMDRLLPSLVAALDAVVAPQRIVARNDSPARVLEGIDAAVTALSGELPAEPVEVREGGLSYLADAVTGQKTGWYFDQRPNRHFMAPLATGGRMLDAYCHSGGFAVAAAAAGAASVMAIDSSAPALALAEQAAITNGVADRCAFRHGDVFAELEKLAAERARFKVVVADPPPFAKAKKDVGSALRGYRKLARLAAALVEPGGFLFIASCSHNIETTAFATEVAAGIDRAGRTGRIVRAFGAGADHPVHPHLPETAYLKTLVLHLD